MDNYVGKVVKISGIDSWKREFSLVGLVYGQEPSHRGNETIFSLIKPNGSIVKSFYVSNNGEIKITSTKIEPEVRSALKEAYKAKIKYDALKEKYTKELSALEKELSSALNIVKETSGELTPTEFMDAVTELFKERYPSSGGYYQKYFEGESCSPTEITLRQVQEIEKWASPEKYSFLFREYDNTIHIHDDSKAFKDFCVKNAPSVIPELAKHCKTDISASLGDKQWLSAERLYIIPIKHGYTQKSIDEIKERFWGIREIKPSIDDKIASAEKQKVPPKNNNEKLRVR